MIYLVFWLWFSISIVRLVSGKYWRLLSQADAEGGDLHGWHASKCIDLGIFSEFGEKGVGSL